MHVIVNFPIENLFYEIDFRPEVPLCLSLSNVLDGYHISVENLRALHRHPCLEISPDLKIVRYQGIPESYKHYYFAKDFDKSIIHFPFLFRPLSLIIPKGGRLTSEVTFRPDPCTGSELRDCHGGDKNYRKTSSGYNIDIFSLFV